MTLNIGWKDLDCKLSAPVLKALTETFKFPNVMPVQNAVVPNFVKNFDVAVEAATGSGKTLAFIIPIFEKLSKMENLEQDEIKALIITPTRDLANQTYQVAIKFQETIGNVGVKCIYGQMGHDDGDKSKPKELESKGQNILITTPGRIAEIQKGNLMNLKSVEYLILDEADRLLDSNFSEEVKSIILQLPKQRRTGLFSATLSSQKLDDLIKAGLRNPVVIRLTKTKEEWGTKHELPVTLSNYYLVVANRLQKFHVLMNYLLLHKDQKIIVFLNTCDSVAFYYKLFGVYIHDRSEMFNKFFVGKITGDIKQAKRTSVLEEFSKIEKGVLFATDVIARGIDFDLIDSIIQVDIPQDPNFFVHRIGRTARKGTEGNALVLLDETERVYLDEYLIEKIPGLQEFSEEGVSDINEGKLLKFTNSVRKLMLTDKDFLMKGPRAFVSFIRSYKEHRLNNILKFKNLDIYQTARSFFLFKLPVMKELMEYELPKPLATADEVDKLEQCQFRDKNQEAMIKKKVEESKANREHLITKRQAIKEKYEKEQGKRKVRSKAERGRAKLREQSNLLDDYKKEEKLERQLKKGKINKDDYEKENSQSIKKYKLK